MDYTTFSGFGLIEPLQRALRDCDHLIPTPVQVQAIPPLLEGRDLLGCAQTGTGKTAAFALPILQHISKERRRREPWSVRALILTPTRELASQIHLHIMGYGKYLDVTHAVVYGGVGQRPQVKTMRRCVDILVATPGRLLDLIGQGYIELQNVEIFVLDEADRMLDMGFIPDVRRIMRYIPGKRQTMFLSATLTSKIVKLAGSIVSDPVHVNVTPDELVVEFIDQRLMMVERQRKPVVLANILKETAATRVLVFTRTKHGANRLVRFLERAGIRARAIHSNKTQSARQKAMDDFRAGSIDVLVATDIAARGIDVEGISHVVNFDIPNVPETYIHRIGRTARAGSRGISISLCSREERGFVSDIQHLIKQPIPVVSTHPYLSDVELGPAEKKPRASRHRKRPYYHRARKRRGTGGRGSRRR
jgi:ATP-dependent RNA helicase RhlE